MVPARNSKSGRFFHGPHWFCDGQCRVPASIKALLYRPTLTAKVLGPFGNAQRFPGRGYQVIGSCVARLLAAGRPPAIPRFVAFVIVWPAIKAVARRFRAHVSQEILETCPTVANRDAAASVGRPSWVARLRAALPHVVPRAPCRRWLAAIPMPVLSIQPSTLLKAKLSIPSRPHHVSNSLRATISNPCQRMNTSRPLRVQ